MERFGDWLRQRRQELGLSQGRLGELIGKPPNSARIYISGIENRRPEGRDVLPSKEMLPALAEALQVSLDEVVRRYGAQKAGVIPEPTNEAWEAFKELPGVEVRPIRSVETPKEKTVRLPVYEDISCGWATEVCDHPTLEDFPEAVTFGADHVVTVKGESMIDVGFYPGTYLFIRSQPGGRPGDIVIARVNDTEYTCKVYRDDGQRQWLEGRSDVFKDRIWFDKHRVQICGIVLNAVWRFQRD